MILETTPTVFSICRLDPGTQIPSWALRGPFFSITQTVDELSVVCAQSDLPGDVRNEGHWRCLKIQGPLDFTLTGILASLANPLSQAGISIFAISTFDTDYLLVKQGEFGRAIEVLSGAGHEVRTP